MAIYATFFVCKPEELLAGFPGWRPPLAKPVRRQFKNPFTGELSSRETTTPEWPDEGDEAFHREYQVVSIDESYEDYLERRLLPFVRANRHWAAKGLTEVELSPLAQAIGVDPKFECPLYSPPSSGAILQELPVEMASRLLALDQQDLNAVAGQWAATMSTPDYTHSVSGERLCDDWAASEAIAILQPIVRLARQATTGQRMYLLIEA